jgi:hypothetical protein
VDANGQVSKEGREFATTYTSPLKIAVFSCVVVSAKLMRDSAENNIDSQKKIREAEGLRDGLDN